MRISIGVLVLFLTACTEAEPPPESPPESPRTDSSGTESSGAAPAASDAGSSWLAQKPDELARGFGWSEGPVWIDPGSSRNGYLLFSDVPGNVVHRWSEAGGVETFLDPSGFAGGPTSELREPGINGMIPGPAGTILACDHGNRAVVRVDLASKQRTVLVDSFQGERLNSPNDLVLAADGSIYFTDPPYGLAGLDDSPVKELDVNGVYRLSADGELSLLDETLSFPNGIALSPDQSTLYVAVSDPEGAIWVAYDRAADGSVSNRRTFHDATERVREGARGLPDGMCIAASGEILSTGPGGLYLFADEGAEPIVVDLGSAAANCTFGGDDRQTLFVTANDRLLRFRTPLSGLPTR